MWEPIDDSCSKKSRKFKDNALRPLLLLVYLILVTVSITSLSAEEKHASGNVLPFGEAGKFKMLYDARQRPHSVQV